MINKKIIIFIAIMSILILDHTTPTITGNILASEINVTINPFENGHIGYFNYSEEVVQYSKMTFEIEFINTGSTTYNKKTAIKIGGYDENLTVIYNKTRLITSLKAGERSIETIKYTPMFYGFYWISVNVSYGNKTAMAWGSFYVKPYYTIIPGIQEPGDEGFGFGSGSGSGGSGSGSGGGSGFESSGGSFSSEYYRTELDTGQISLSTIYPNKIQIAAGESSAVYIILNNTGTMTLRQLKLLPRILGDIKIDALPRVVQTLRKNNSAIFMITIDVPKNIKNGTYPLEFKILSDKINRTGFIDVNVGSTPAHDDLLNTILNYRYLITKLKDEKQTLDLYGKNTIKLTQYLNYSESELIFAKNAYELKDYKDTRDHLKITRVRIIDALTELSRIKNQEKLVVFAPTSWLLLLLIILIIFTTITIHRHKHNLSKKKNGELF